MNANCKDFRHRLRDALEGGLRGESPSPEAVRPLSWHEHLFTCGECRDLLETEEALEEVLASLPVPILPKRLAKRILTLLATERRQRGAEYADLDGVLTTGDSVEIPAGLARRILAGVSTARERGNMDSLDALLELVPNPVAPLGLSARVLDGVREESELALDALLDLVSAPRIPIDLAENILKGLDGQRAGTLQATKLRPNFRALRYVAAVAATLAIVLGAWRFRSEKELTGFGAGREGLVQESAAHGRPERDEPNENVAGLDVEGTVDDASNSSVDQIEVLEAQTAPNRSLLASLDVLEDWELLMSEDIDVLLGSLDEADAELLFMIDTAEGEPILESDEG
jgi:hypothetical protein